MATNEQSTTNNTRRPTHIIYSVRDRGQGMKAAWTEVGIAFTNRDGSLNLIFNCLPLDGRCTLRLFEPKGAAEE